MNKEEQRIAIAEHLGWKPDDDGAGINTWQASWVGDRLYGLKPIFLDGKVKSYVVDCLVPDYPHDYNAMRCAINDLKPSQREWLFLVELPKILGVPVEPMGDAWWKIQCPTVLLEATSESLAEAFVSTVKNK